MKDNVDIFICTHKDFEKIVSNDAYKVIDSRVLKKNGFEIFGLNDVELSEWYHIFYILRNAKLKDYVGICHYRRYFDFLDNIPNFDDIFKEYDVITRTPINIQISIKKQYELCHNIEDLKLLGTILKEKFIEYYDTYNKFIETNEMIPCNMIIMKRDDFIKFASFMEDVLKEIFYRIGTDLYKRVLENEDKYVKKNSPNNTHMYQIRLITFVMERLTNIYIMKNFNNPKRYDVIITENKYGLKNNMI